MRILERAAVISLLTDTCLVLASRHTALYIFQGSLIQPNGTLAGVKNVYVGESVIARRVVPGVAIREGFEGGGLYIFNLTPAPRGPGGFGVYMPVPVLDCDPSFADYINRLLLWK